jgi:ParB family chromosome partitioning protein
MVKKRGLGRGLEALLGGVSERAMDKPATPDPAAPGGFQSLPVDVIRRGKHQPRRIVEESSLEELAHSVQARGIVQPIVVRPTESGGFEIVAGERRWRAAQMAGLDEVPAIVRECSDREAAAIALIENIQREDLNPIEEAQGYRTLADEFGLTHQELADAVGRSRSAVSNALRLLDLNEDVRALVEQSDLDMGHARALLSLSGAVQSETAAEVVRRGLSARETERLVRSKVKGDAAPERTARDPDVVRIENEIADRLGAKVRIDHKTKGTGSLTIHYTSLEALDGILERIR